VGDGEKLVTYLNSALKVLSGLDIFRGGTKKKLNFVDQCYLTPPFRFPKFSGPVKQTNSTERNR
jgi:hypothetical protein